MIPVRITWLYEPRRAPPDPLGAGPDYYAPLVEEIGRFAGVSIPLVHGFLRDEAPSDGIILINSQADAVLMLDECAVQRRADLARRLVPLNGGRNDALETYLEPLSLPAMVDGLSHAEWSDADADEQGAYGPFGRRDIGQLVGASCMMYESERYCFLHSPTHHGLPHLLADYLTAYANTVLLAT